MSAALLLRPDEMEAAKASLEKMLAKPPAFPVLRAITPAARALIEKQPPSPPPAPIPVARPAPLPLPPPRRGPVSFPPGERFVAAMEREIAEERQAAHQAAKLEPLTFTISDQQELRVLYELAGRFRSKPIPFIRRHLRGWGRTELDAKRTEQLGEPVPSN
jgi:hypothetical protein